jgi:hypothetical protein
LSQNRQVTFPPTAAGLLFQQRMDPAAAGFRAFFQQIAAREPAIYQRLDSGNNSDRTAAKQQAKQHEAGR